MTGAEKIAIIEDDETIREVLRMTLAAAGFRHVEASGRGDDGLEMVLRFRPDVLLLDLMLPGLDGMEICRRLRARSDMDGLGILMLTAKGETEDVVAGLEAGADDYVVKPFSRSVLVARIEAVLRRTAPAVAKGLDGFVLDPTPTLDGKPVSLNRTEMSLMDVFLRRPGRFFTRERLMAATGGENDRSIDVQIAGLRKKLGRWAVHIETVRGVGYRVRP